VAGDKIGLPDQVRRPDRLRAETQVRYRAGARFFGVVHKIALREQVGIFADDFDAVFIGAHRAVGAQAEKQGLPPPGLVEVKFRIIVQAACAPRRRGCRR
jgi:hypothetical protein